MMETQTNKKFHTFDVGENILLPVPEFDKSSPFYYRNLGCVILGSTEDGLYQIGNPSGRLARSYSCNQFSFSMSQNNASRCPR